MKYYAQINSSAQILSSNLIVLRDIFRKVKMKFVVYTP